MELTVLGCSGSGPGPLSPSSGYLLRAGERALVCDLGNGALGALYRYLDPFQLDALLLSHLHPDHCADVASLVVYRRYHPTPPYPPTERRLPVYAPAEAAHRLTAQYGSSEAERHREDLTDVLEFQVLADRAAFDVAGVRIQIQRVVHPCESYALRFEHGGRSLVYSGDTGACRELIELARGADVLLCEATWPHPGPGEAARPGCTCRGGKPASTPRPPTWVGCCSPTSRCGSTRRCCSPRPRRRSTARSRWSARGPATRSDLAE